VHSVYRGSTLAGSQIVARREANVQSSWGSAVRIIEERKQGLVVGFNDK